jgi:hypothetical protein
MCKECVQKQVGLLNLVKEELANSKDLLEAKTRVFQLGFLLGVINDLERQEMALSAVPHPLPLG